MTPEQLARVIFDIIERKAGGNGYTDDSMGLTRAVIDCNVDLVAVAEEALAQIGGAR